MHVRAVGFHLRACRGVQFVARSAALALRAQVCGVESVHGSPS